MTNEEQIEKMLAGFQRRIRDTREDSDESQDKLADALGTSQTMITRYERGDSNPGIRFLLKFCIHYKVSADYLLGLPKSFKNTR